MLSDFEITFTGGFAIVTILMWLLGIVIGLIVIYQSRLLKPLRKFIASLKVLSEPRKHRNQYNNLHTAGYIYKWSRDLCLRKFK